MCGCKKIGNVKRARKALNTKVEISVGNIAAAIGGGIADIALNVPLNMIKEKLPEGDFKNKYYTPVALLSKGAGFGATAYYAKQAELKAFGVGGAVAASMEMAVYLAPEDLTKKATLSGVEDVFAMIGASDDEYITLELPNGSASAEMPSMEEAAAMMGVSEEEVAIL